jgi:hypothetical protein
MLLFLVPFQCEFGAEQLPADVTAMGGTQWKWKTQPSSCHREQHNTELGPRSKVKQVLLFTINELKP